MPRCERDQRCSFTITKYLYAFTCCRVIGTNQLLLQVLTHTRSLNYSSIKNKLGSVIECFKLIPEGLEDYDAIDSSLVPFHKVVIFLTISVERMELARPLCNRVLVNINEIKAKVKNFLYEIGYNVVERLLGRS